MASVRREIQVTTSVEEAWAAIRDIGSLHTRLVPGFVIDTKLEPGARVVTFGNGLVVREQIVDIDDEARRLVWAIRNERLDHYNASAQVYEADGGQSKIVWTADLLPNENRETIAGMMAQGMAAMKRTLDAIGQKGPSSG